MRLKVIGLIAVMLLAVGGMGVVQANGVSPAKLVKAGWTCFNVPGLGVHCFGPAFEPDGETINVSVFHTDDPATDDAHFLGTELLIRADLYNGQPCPQSTGGSYDLLPKAATGLAADYYACHHYSH